MKEKLWTEKYRPTDLNKYVFSNETIEELFKKYIREKEFPHLLLSGIQGTGKTTIARILISKCNLNSIDIKTINASSKTGIDTVRDGIERFCKTLPMGEFKVVLLEESDSLSVPAQKALRAIIEESSDNVRFIFTCNYPNKIIEPIHSRLQNIHITELDYDSFVENVINILVSEDVEVSNIEDVTEHVDLYFPDMRKVINSVQQSSVSGTLKGVISKSKSSGDIEEWKNVWIESPTKNKLMDLVRNMNLDNVDDVYRVMYDNVNNLKEELRDNAYSVIAEHLYKVSFVVDQEINLMACIIEMFDE